jgi:phospholipase C
MPGRAEFTRRRFLGGAAAVAASAGLLARPDRGIAETLARPRLTGSLDDVEHVVILMQENRSFDHYYGTMAGVRGFGDRAALQLASGNDVLHQPDALRLDGGYLLPFRVDTAKVDGQDMGDLAHDWDTTHLAWDGGSYDQWTLAKTEMTMGFFDVPDIPFHRALAAAFTICDSYHCSIMGPTTPNRLYHWTGTIDPAGLAGGPATSNPPDYQPVYSWTTYPERLQAAGIDWQVYANHEVGDSSTYPDDFVGDYGDNPLWLFQAYHDALASPHPKVRQLAKRAAVLPDWLPYSGKGLEVNHVIAQFRADCKAGTLPAVSWVVAPYGYCEHPAARPVDGEAYVQAVLRALWANPALWESTVVLINYDENDGFFDHVPPPVPPPGTADEFLPAIQPILDGLPPAAGPPTPIGLGPRVPMTVISPWSAGGWVNSQVFDHTSVLRFLEAWTGVAEPNISAWRRSVCGDLTSCFDFASSDTVIPLLPDTAALRARANKIDPTLPAPSTPALGAQTVPIQAAGTAPARPLPYQPLVNFSVGAAALSLHLANSGEATVNLAAYAQQLVVQAVHNYDVAAGAQLTKSVDLGDLAAYDTWVHGPNGFLAHAAGSGGTNLLGVEATLSITGSAADPALSLQIANAGLLSVTAQITDLSGASQSVVVAGGSDQSLAFDPSTVASGWYDLTVTLDGYPGYARRFAGHLENGLPSITG